MEVKLIDVMGDDLRVVNAARVSFSKESEWEKDIQHNSCETCDCHQDYAKDFGYCYSKLSEKDQKLIKYLATHNHWTPFSHVQITLREKVPIFVARQRFKHMVGFTYNEVSRRYVSDEPTFFIPSEWRKASENKKQGSSDEVITGKMPELYLPGNDYPTTYTISENYAYLLNFVEELYNQMIKMGVAPEQARMVLPQSMYTEYYCTGSLAAWARAYKLRIDNHAQKEIRTLAVMWNNVISGIKELEHSWKALAK